jgi:hypothetical protein
MADAPGLTVRIKLQDTSGNMVYTGNPARSLRLWGATFELGRVEDRRFGDFANFYHYVRSLGSAGDYQDSQYLFDARADNITVGGTVAAKVARTGENPNEYIAFNYIKQAQRAGVAPGSLRFNAGSPSSTASTVVAAPDLNSVTYEWWFRHGTTSAILGFYQCMLSTRPTSPADSSGGMDVRIMGAGSYASISVRSGTTNLLGGSTTGVGTVLPSTWYHIALVRNGTSACTVYLNGSSIGTFAKTGLTDTALILGNDQFNKEFGGNISNFRYVRGTAVYTDNFTPPTPPLTAISGTELLLNTSNDANFLRDDSGNNRTMTNNNVTSSSLNPLNIGPQSRDSIIPTDGGRIAFGGGTSVLTNIRTFIS